VFGEIIDLEGCIYEEGLLVVMGVERFVGKVGPTGAVKTDF